MTEINGNQTYLRGWAEENKKPTPAGLAGWLVGILVWATCIVTFLAVYDPTMIPEWATNITRGLRWTLLGLVGFLVGLMFVGVISIPVVYAALKVNTDDRNEKAKSGYEKYKNDMANAVVSKGTPKYRYLFRVAQVMLLFAGGAVFTGICYGVGVTFIIVCQSVILGMTKSAAEQIITPANVAWLTTPTVPESLKNGEVIVQFPNRIKDHMS